MLLWRWRHLVIALTTGLAVIVILSVLVPRAPDQRDVLILARPVQAGQVLAAEDLERARLPDATLPEAGLADESVLGTRAAIPLEPGTVLTTAMTSAALAAGLSEGERVVQVPVAVGAGLAQAGALVDLVAPREWVGQDPGLSPGASVSGGGDAGTGGLSSSDGQASGDGVTSGTEPDGASQGGWAVSGDEQVVLCASARVLLTQPPEESGGTWSLGRGTTGGGTMVTLVTLAVPMDAAPVIVSVATRGALGLVLSP